MRKSGLGWKSGMPCPGFLQEFLMLTIPFELLGTHFPIFQELTSNICDHTSPIQNTKPLRTPKYTLKYTRNPPPKPKYRKIRFVCVWGMYDCKVILGSPRVRQRSQTWPWLKKSDRGVSERSRPTPQRVKSESPESRTGDF